MTDDKPEGLEKEYEFICYAFQSGALSPWSALLVSLSNAIPEKHHASYTPRSKLFQDKNFDNHNIYRLMVRFYASDDKEANKVRERILNAFLMYTEQHPERFYFLRGPAGELYEIEDKEKESYEQRKVAPGMAILDMEDFLSRMP